MQATFKNVELRSFQRAAIAPGTLLAGWLGHVVDASLAALLLLAPLFMGGRGAAGQLVFVSLSCLAAIAWSAKQTLVPDAKWRWSGVEWLLASGALLVALQLVPWPAVLLKTLLPATHDLLPLWTGGQSDAATIGQWSMISLTPELTRGGLTIYLSYVLLFLLLVQRMATVKDVERVLCLVAVAAVAMAVVGLAQFFAGSDKFLWIYEHPSRSASLVARGTFQNENHLAHFLSLGLGPLLWCLYRSRQRQAEHHPEPRRSAGRNRGLRALTDSRNLQPMLLVGLILVALAGLFTFSRGGVLTMAIALLSCIAAMRWKSLIDRRTATILSLASLVNFSAVLIFGYDSLSVQLNSVLQAASSKELFAGRMELWNAICAGISRFYLTGTGVGSHREVHLVFMKETFGVEFTHGESGYLPLLLETGVCGLVLMVIGIVTSFQWCVCTLTASGGKRDSDSRAEKSSATFVSCACAVFPSLVASVVHSLADFVWYIPACMVMTIAQVAVACRIYQMSHRKVGPSGSRSTTPTADGSRYLPMPRGVSIAVAGVVVLAASVMVGNRWGPARAALDWDAYLKHSIVRAGTPPLTPSQERERQTAMETHLSNILRSDPCDARAHLRLAAVYLKQFELAQRSAENSMDLSQIRDAALASRFPTKAAQDSWLNVALGSSRPLLDKALAHSHRAVALSPLQGLGYVQLAELSFLETPRAEWKQAYIEQAVRVRPHDGKVLFVRGKEAALAGDLERAFHSWKQAFRHDPETRQIIIEAVADQIPAAFFLSTFEPDLPALGQLFQRYRAQGRVEEAELSGRKFIKALQQYVATRSGVDAANGWHQAQEAYLWFGDSKQALACQRRAVELVPLHFGFRRHLAHLLLQQQQIPEAIDQFEWCLRRQPDDQSLRQELADAKILQLQTAPSPRLASQPGAHPISSSGVRAAGLNEATAQPTTAQPGKR